MVMAYYIVFLLMALIIIGFLLITKIHWGYILLILSVPITCIKFSIYSPDVNLFNVFFPFHIIVFAVLVAVFLSRVTNKLKYDPEYNPFSIIVFFFAFWALITIFWAPDHKFSLFRYCQLLLSVLAYFLMVKLLITKRDLKRAINAWIFMGILASVALLFSLLLKDMYVFTKEIGKDLFYVYLHVGYLNPMRGSGFSDPKLTANFINFAALFAIGSVVIVQEPKQKLKLMSIAGFMMFSHLFAQARGALGGLLVAIAFLLIALRPLRRSLIKNISILGFSLLIMFLIFLSFQVIVRGYHAAGLKGVGTRLVSMEEGAGSMEDRFDIWSKISGIFRDHNAYVFGIGAGGSAYYCGVLPHVHGFFLSIAYDLGLIGLGIFFIMVAILISGFFRMLRSEDSYYRTMLCSFYAGLIAFSINGLIEFEYFVPLIWVYLGMGIAVWRLFRKEENAS